jgi:gamma-glutamylcyclotransferase (GGCT)/AIG2-like uncharacterized protein YtfP
MDVPESSPRPWAETPDPELYLFIYGTLMIATGIAEVDAALRDAGPSLGRGWIHGRLYDLGEYPGAVALAPPDRGTRAQEPALEAAAHPIAEALDEGAPRVWGRLLHLRDPAGLYSVIDRYEGFDAGDPTGSEFVRGRTQAFLPGRNQGIPCQVYWYNLSAHGRQEIPSGDYLPHWQSRGKPAQGRIVS